MVLSHAPLRDGRPAAGVRKAAERPATVATSVPGVYSVNLNPVPVSGAASASITVSFKPPVARTIGTVP